MMKSEIDLKKIVAGIGALISLVVLYILLLNPPAKLQSQQPIIKEIVIPIYNVTYNISKLINTTVFEIPDEKYVLLVYSSRYEKVDLSKVVEIARSYNFTIYLYDINKPWYGLKLTENITIPLAPLLPTPIMLCINNETVHALIGKQLEDTQNIILIMEKCKNIQ